MLKRMTEKTAYRSVQQARMTPRRLAAEVLVGIDERGAFSNHMLNLRERELPDERDRRFLRELVYGVLENRTYLDVMLDRVSSRKMNRLKPMLRQILRVGCYELILLNTPPHAAVNEAIRIVRAAEPRAAGFANAVLRSIDRRRDEVAVIGSDDPVERLSIRYSHPKWIVEYLLDQFTLDETERMLKLNNEPAPLSVFIDPTKISRSAAKAALEAAGMINLRESAISEHCLLMDGGALTATSLFRNGVITVASPPSMRIAELTVEGVGDASIQILDLCAAPGSKTIGMAAFAPNAHIVSNDVAENKMPKILENAARMGKANIRTSVWDATVPRAEWQEAFDIVLVDAPCSGLGLLRRKPDIRWHREPEALAALAEMACKIVEHAAGYLKPGGRLVYSTCTYGRIENEAVFDHIVRMPGLDPEMIDGERFRQFTALEEASDGFFAARFRKSLSLD